MKSTNARIKELKDNHDTEMKHLRKNILVLEKKIDECKKKRKEVKSDKE